jgi:O-antigen ligase
MMLSILLLFIFFRPFISSLAFPYANIAYSLAFLGFLGLWAISKKIRPADFSAVKYPLIFFSCTLLISSVFSVDRLNSFSIDYQYASGILIFLICASLADKERSLLINVIISAGVIISLLAIHQYFFGFARLASFAAKEGIKDPFLADYINSRRVFVPFVTPNILAGYLAMLLPLAYLYKGRLWLFALLGIALILTGSLGALLSVLIASIVYLALSGKMKSKKAVYLFFACLGAIIIAVFIIRCSRNAHLQPGFSAFTRVNYWLDSLKMISWAPLTGVGPGNFNLAGSRYAHNSYLQIWAETGTLGLVSFLWLVFAGMRDGFKRLTDRSSACLFLASLIFLLHNFLDFTFFLPEVSLIWWAVLGLLQKEP